jgi:hypothetical protein
MTHSPSVSLFQNGKLEHCRNSVIAGDGEFEVIYCFGAPRLWSEVTDLFINAIVTVPIVTLTVPNKTQTDMPHTLQRQTGFTMPFSYCLIKFWLYHEFCSMSSVAYS